MPGEPERRTQLRHRVAVVVPDLEMGEHRRLERAMHAADRSLGVITGATGRYVLLTKEPDEASARAYATAILARATELAGMALDVAERAEIGEVTAQEVDLTGRPRRASAVAGRFRVVDVGERGRIRVLHEGPMGEWIVQLEGEHEAWRGRMLSSVLNEVFVMPHGHNGAWFDDLVAELSGHQTPIGLRFACPCCEMLTLTTPTGSHGICAVCGWQDDGVQFEDPDYRGGANRPSLREARETYARIGASEVRRLPRTRKPLDAELPGGRD